MYKMLTGLTMLITPIILGLSLYAKPEVELISKIIMVVAVMIYFLVSLFNLIDGAMSTKNSR